MTRVRELDDEEIGDLKAHFAPVVERLGFVPNSQRVMAHKPELLEAFAALSKAVNNQTDQSIPSSLKYMIANAASLAAGCRYCVAHTAGGGSRAGVDDERIKALWEFETSDLFSDAERAALAFAQAAAAVPNMVGDADFDNLRRHFTDYQIVEIVGVISVFGFLNRWNDTMATTLEDEPIEFAERTIRSKGWDGGKHVAGRPATAA